MRPSWILTFAVGALATVAFAQQPDTPQQGRGQPGGRARPDPRGGMREGGMSFSDLAQRLATQLNLSTEQRTAYDAIVARYQAQEEAEPDRDAMREMAAQMRAAREAGDEQTAEQLRARFRERGAARAQSVRAFMTELEPILTPEQQQTLHDVQDRMQQRYQGARAAAEQRVLIERLPDELSLTPDQKAQYDVLVQDVRDGRGRQRERWDELRSLRDELRTAQDNGDEQRVRELREQLAAAREPGGAMQDFFSQLEPILTAEQREKLATLRAATDSPRGPGARGGTLDVRAVLRAAKQLKLTEQQEEQLKTIQREAQQQERATQDLAGRNQVAQQIKARIVALLDQTQAAEFERLLARDARPQRGGGRGGRPGEQGGAAPASGGQAGAEAGASGSGAAGQSQVQTGQRVRRGNANRPAAPAGGGSGSGTSGG